MSVKDAFIRYGLEELKIVGSPPAPCTPNLAYCENDIIGKINVENLNSAQKKLVTEELLRKQFKEEKKEMNLKITLIGSIKNGGEAMMEIYNRLTLRGNLVMLPYMGVVPEDADDMIEQLHDIHREKMRIADFVVVVDQNGYIGKDTQAKIKWCENHGKQVIYASDLNMADKPLPAMLHG